MDHTTLIVVKVGAIEDVADLEGSGSHKDTSGRGKGKEKGK
mgnify:CR=1 FL=1